MIVLRPGAVPQLVSGREALDSSPRPLIELPVTRTTRVERTCPRCHKRLLHVALIATREIICTECGHAWVGKLSSEDTGEAEMNEEDWDALRIIAMYSGKLHSSGKSGRMTLAQAKRLAAREYVTISRPKIEPYSKRRPNRSWTAEVTEAGRQALAVRNAQKEQAHGDR